MHDESDFTDVTYKLVSNKWNVFFDISLRINYSRFIDIALNKYINHR